MDTTVQNFSTIHVRLPNQVLSDIDDLCGCRKRSKFLAETASKELRRLRMVRAFKNAAGAWKDNDHPELRHGSVAYIRKLRREWDVRFRKQFSR